MSRQPDHGVESADADADALPRPEEEVADAVRDATPSRGAAASGEPPVPREPVAGGTDDSEPAQGEGAPNSH